MRRVILKFLHDDHEIRGVFHHQYPDKVCGEMVTILIDGRPESYSLQNVEMREENDIISQDGQAATRESLLDTGGSFL